ncbi:MAG: formylglycine-generating enzyme family protein [Saprospiraceae bacterium]|nr:formylglycine-generating enzyme family protein [Saprospiraceae bacterium]
MSPAHRVRAWRVLEAMGPAHIADPAGLKMYLAPVFARSATEQEQFYTVFERFVAKITEPDPDVELVDAQSDIPPEPKQSRKGQDYILWGLLLLFVIVVNWEAWQQYNSDQKKKKFFFFSLEKLINGKGQDPAFEGAGEGGTIFDKNATFRDGDSLLVINVSKYANQTDSLSYHFNARIFIEGDKTQGELLQPFGPNSWLTVLKPPRGFLYPFIEIYGNNTANTWKDTFKYSFVIQCAHIPDFPALQVPKSIQQGGTLKCNVVGKLDKGLDYAWVIDNDTPIHGATASKKIDQAGQVSVQFTINDTLAAGACARDTSFTVQVGDERVQLPLPAYVTDQSEPVGKFNWLSYLILLLTGVLAVWSWYQWSRRKAPKPPEPQAGVRTNLPEKTDKPPYYIPFREQKGVLRSSKAEFRLGDALRLRQEGQHQLLDIPATLQATLDRGGFPTARFRYQTKPTDYLFLVDEQLPGNHLARLFRHLAENLRGQDVHLELFWYDAGFTRFWNRDVPLGLSLEGLQRAFPEHRLVILGNGHALIDPFAENMPRLRPNLVASLKAWSMRLLLTPQPVVDWNWRESAIYRWFPLFPADIQGMLKAAEFIEGGLDLEDLVGAGPAPAQQRSAALAAQQLTVPAQRTTDPRAGASPAPTDAPTDATTRWIQALSVTPTPTWETTLAIARALNIPVDHDAILQIARIPALQEGAWHPRQRQALLASLSEEDERAARQSVRAELEAVRDLAKDGHAALELETGIAVQSFILDPEDADNQALVTDLLERGLLPRQLEAELNFALARKQQPKAAQGPLKINICYVQDDAEQFYNLLERLRPLEADGAVQIWHYSTQPTGKDWAAQLQEHVVAADIHLMLLSPAFLGTQSIMEETLPLVLESVKIRQTQVLNILARPCNWDVTRLKQFEFIPLDAAGQPLAILSDRNEAEGSMMQQSQAPTKKGSKAKRTYTPEQVCARAAEAVFALVAQLRQARGSADNKPPLNLQAWLDAKKPEPPKPPKRPFFTLMFVLSCAISLVFADLLIFGWMLEGSSELRTRAFAPHTYVPGRDTLRSHALVREVWAIDSAVLYNNLGVIQAERGLPAVDPVFKNLSAPGPNAYQALAFFARARQLSPLKAYLPALQNSATAWYLLAAQSLNNEASPVQLLQAASQFDSAAILAAEHFPRLSADAAHGKGLCYFYSKQRDSALLVYQYLRARAYFDSLTLRPNLETLLGITTNRINSVQVQQAADGRLRLQIAYQLAFEPRQDPQLTVEAIDKTGKVLTFNTKSQRNARLGANTATLYLPEQANVAAFSADSLRVRLLDGYGKNLASWQQARRWEYYTPKSELRIIYDSIEKLKLLDTLIKFEPIKLEKFRGDSDKDGTPDTEDQCPQDPNKTQPGACGCAVPDTDSDGDSVPDCNDKCPKEPGDPKNGGCPIVTPFTPPDMVRVRGGTFRMGSEKKDENVYDDEMPAHDVTLSNFSIGRTEVTQALWRAVMNNNPSNFENCDQCPVEQVSWNDIQEFLQKLNTLDPGKNYRLPTEAEWEYAARGGPPGKQSFVYAGSDKIDEVAWYDGNSDNKTYPVGQKKANALGLFDMSGNVWEWCNDWFGDYSAENQRNPKGPDSGSSRVFRGGSWFNLAPICRVAIRNNSTPGFRNDFIGFRLASSPQ